jgi:hypothetical protein
LLSFHHFVTWSSHPFHILQVRWPLWRPTSAQALERAVKYEEEGKEVPMVQQMVQLHTIFSLSQLHLPSSRVRFSFSWVASAFLSVTAFWFYSLLSSIALLLSFSIAVSIAFSIILSRSFQCDTLTLSEFPLSEPLIQSLTHSIALSESLFLDHSF